MQYLIQRYNEESLEIKQVVEDLGVGVIFPNVKNIYEDNITLGGPTPIHSSVDSFCQIEKDNPGMWSLTNWDAMKPSTYHAYWGQKCFNYEGVFLPAAEVVRRYEELEDSFRGELFIKPNTAKKVFSGEVFEGSEDIQHFLDYGHVKPSDLLQVCPSYKIDKEYRVFTNGPKVISSSLYKENGELKVDGKDRPVELKSFVEGLTRYEGLPFICAIDVAYSDTWGYYVLEISSVNCCGWYEADKKKIVRHILSEALIVSLDRDMISIEEYRKGKEQLWSTVHAAQEL